MITTTTIYVGDIKMGIRITTSFFAYAVQGVQRAAGVPAGGRGLPGEGQEERMLLRLRTDLGSDE